MKQIYWFNEVSKESLAQAGENGAGLGELSNAGFNVAPGFIVSADCFTEFMQKNGLDALVRLKTDRLDFEDTYELEQASQTIRKAISGAEMPNDLRVEIVRAYNKLCGVDFIPSMAEEVLVAVCPSPTSQELAGVYQENQEPAFTSVSGSEELVKSVRKCWAQLFETKAIYARNNKQLSQTKAGIAVVIQKIVQSNASGIMYTAEPATGEASRIIIEAGFGLGEAITSGMITPDQFILDKVDLRISRKQVNKQESMIVRNAGKIEAVEVPQEMQESQKINEREIMKLAQVGLRLEEHFQKPQQTQWAIQDSELFIVQTHAMASFPKTEKTLQGQEQQQEARVQEKKEIKETTPEMPNVEQLLENLVLQNQEAKAVQTTPVEEVAQEQPRLASPIQESPIAGAMLDEILLQGIPASAGIASGRVKIVLDSKDAYKVGKGEVIVTRMTSPDFVTSMKRASAIITDEGGINCHAAILSREIGIPCISGTITASHLLKQGDMVTVDGSSGRVYPGLQKQSEATAAGEKLISREIADPQEKIITGTKIYASLNEINSPEKNAGGFDGVGLFSGDLIIAALGIHPKKMLAEGRKQELTDSIARALRRVCIAFENKPVIYRPCDFKSSEYRKLEGGECEPHEENPEIGFRGCFRLLKEPEVFQLELDAIKKVREQYGMKNLWLVIPFVRTLAEYQAVKNMVEEKMPRSHDFKLGIMCELPSNVLLAEEFCEEGLDFMSISANSLTELILGVDRSNPLVSEDFDERNPAVINAISKVIADCHKHGVKVSICTDAGTNNHQFTEEVIRLGIDRLTISPECLEETRKIIASTEQKMLLERKGGN